MASNGNVMSATQPLIPIFKGEGYEFWSIRMRTLLKSQDLWDLVEQGYPDPDEESRLKENKKKDSKALVIIQQVVHDSVFSRIAAATTSKQAWSILRKEFQGDSKVIVVRLQSLRRDFETLYMKSGESIADFLSRAMAIVSQMRSYGEKISDETVVAKVLRSLTPKFDHVVAAIEESKDLSIFSFDELMGSLQAHESRINRSLEKNEEKAFQVKETVIRTAEAQSATFRGRGRGGFRGRGYGRGRGRLDWQQRQFGEQREFGEQRQFGCRMINISMTQNKMFPLEVSKMENFVLATGGIDDSKLWHLRYGHLNIKGLKLLSEKVRQAEDGIFISQRKYAKDLLNKFGMLNCQSEATPMNTNEKLQREDGAKVYASSFKASFRSGEAGLAGTVDYGIWYSKVANFRLCGFTDSDWGNSLDDRRSISANVFSLGLGVITWSSKKQATAALSSSEAEYIATTSAACQAIWLRRILAELQQRQEGAT
ncbi:hypothetical protein RJ640_024310 [Escallonia rubra]|uniref:Uncharacterized protein n=1 Tax=Escallonia rubra TaxID=112253 RepID=A0AA88RGW0_9ASTE|nr:hypothetical protein RJ640_024310 [Escallonia rubra]